MAGPMRQPVMKLGDSQMRQVREGLAKSGFSPDEGDAIEFLPRSPSSLRSGVA